MAECRTTSGRTLSYQYDPAGNRTRLTFPDTGANALYISYVYDVLNRVTSIGENGAISGVGLLASYGYDSLGRRQTVTRAGGTGAATSYGYGGTSFTHDARGDLTSDGTRAFTYSLDDQLLTGSAPTATFQYDGSGLMGEYDGTGNILVAINCKLTFSPESRILQLLAEILRRHPQSLAPMPTLENSRYEAFAQARAKEVSINYRAVSGRLGVIV